VRVPYGINNTGPTSGVLAPLAGNAAGRSAGAGWPQADSHGKERGRITAQFSEDIKIEVAPFMGAMTVAPSTVTTAAIRAQLTAMERDGIVQFSGQIGQAHLMRGFSQTPRTHSLAQAGA
jgi:hypothetical protein